NYVRSIFDSISEGLAILDPQGFIESANPSFFDLTGLTQNGLNQIRMRTLLKDQISGEYLQTDDFDGEFLLKQTNEKFIPVSISCTVRKDENNEAGTVLVIKDIRELLETQDRLKQLANFDTLTGARNRRSFQEEWSKFQSSTDAAGTSVGLVMLDVDYFKRINDIRGHAAGDEVLSGIGHILNEEVGDDGLVCRYGGEEFCFVLFDKNENEAFEFAENVRQKIAKSNFAFAGRRIKVTCTFGVSAAETSSVILEELTNEADQILTQTKRTTRNKVGIAKEIKAAEPRPERNETPVQTYVNPIPSVYQTRRVREVQDFIKVVNSPWCLVIDEKGNHVGCLEKAALLRLDKSYAKKKIIDVADCSIPTFESETPAGMVASFMDRCKPPIVVITHSSGSSNICKPIGYVSEEFAQMFREQFDSKKAMAASV
ncbi:MAG: diguanylate cyclase, partial [Planctomycetota bacterium]